LSSFGMAFVTVFGVIFIVFRSFRFGLLTIAPNLLPVLKEAGGSLDNLVMTTTYITDRKYREGYNRVRTQYYKKSSPTSTLVIVSGLAHPDYLIEIASVAVL